MTQATVAIVATTALLQGCTGGSDDAPELTGSPTSSATPPQPVPSVDSSSKGAVAIRGDWHDPKVEWVVHFEEDGSFTEDFEGLVDFRTGSYEVEGTTVRLFGDDGNTDEGVLSSDGSIAFELGTLVRQ